MEEYLKEYLNLTVYIIVNNNIVKGKINGIHEVLYYMDNKHLTYERLFKVNYFWHNSKDVYFTKDEIIDKIKSL